MNFSWEMRGLDMHFDTSLGNRLSRLIKSLTSLADPQASEKPAAVLSSLSSTPAVGGSIANVAALPDSDAFGARAEQAVLAPRRSLEEGAMSNTQQQRTSHQQHLRQRSLDSPEPLNLRAPLSTVAESDRASENSNSQLFASDAALDSPDHLQAAPWDDTSLPYTARLRAINLKLASLQCADN